MSEYSIAAASLLERWLLRLISSDDYNWIQEHRESTAAGDFQAFTMGFGMTPRKLSKYDLNLGDYDLEYANYVRAGWNPSQWTVDQGARTLLILSMPFEDKLGYLAHLTKVFNAADVGELVTLYQALPLLPYSEAHSWRASEGIRSNMKAVFCAVAHRNPYPSEELDENTWNQMVLKSLFIGAELHPIIGLDKRCNPALAQMLIDYAHERWAAKRAVSPELWRCVGPHANDEALNDLAKVLETGSEVERHAAALALSSCPDPRAADLLETAPKLAIGIARKQISWESVCQPG